MPGKAYIPLQGLSSCVPLVLHLHELHEALHEPAMCMSALCYVEGLGIGNAGMAEVRGSWEAVRHLPGLSRVQLKAACPLCLDNGTLAASHLFVRLQP